MDRHARGKVAGELVKVARDLTSVDGRSIMRDAQNLMTSAETRLGELEMYMRNYDEFSETSLKQLLKANAEIRKLSKMINNDMRRLKL